MERPCNRNPSSATIKLLATSVYSFLIRLAPTWPFTRGSINCFSLNDAMTIQHSCASQRFTSCANEFSRMTDPLANYSPTSSALPSASKSRSAFRCQNKQLSTNNQPTDRVSFFFYLKKQNKVALQKECRPVEREKFNCTESTTCSRNVLITRSKRGFSLSSYQRENSNMA